MKNCKMLKLKKGITIVEAVITLVLIGIIMVSAVSVVLMSIDVENNSNTAVELKNSAENILECFRFAETEEEFETAIKKCGNYIKDEDGNFVLAGGNVTVTVTTDFTEKTLKYLAVDSKGKELYSFNFPYAQVPLTDDASQEGEGE